LLLALYKSAISAHKSAGNGEICWEILVSCTNYACPAIFAQMFNREEAEQRKRFYMSCPHKASVTVPLLSGYQFYAIDHVRTKY
jgi:hypothetical protein